VDSVDERLIDCFSAVFPGLSPEEAKKATMDTLPAWDSSHHFMLMQIVEEAFGTPVPEEMMGEIDSFAGFRDYLLKSKG
jgi:acyl carrier protein